jgi:hypothetical protein
MSVVNVTRATGMQDAVTGWRQPSIPSYTASGCSSGSHAGFVVQTAFARALASALGSGQQSHTQLYVAPGYNVPPGEQCGPPYH